MSSVTNLLLPLYPWLKALHTIAVISWMAGLLYLPRLYVHHCGAEVGSEMSETFKVMERRLERAIMTPAMIASLVLGLAMLVANPELLQGAAFRDLPIDRETSVAAGGKHHLRLVDFEILQDPLDEIGVALGDACRRGQIRGLEHDHATAGVLVRVDERAGENDVSGFVQASQVVEVLAAVELSQLESAFGIASLIDEIGHVGLHR
jgi:hypothetical protein